VYGAHVYAHGFRPETVLLMTPRAMVALETLNFGEWLRKVPVYGRESQ